MQPSNLLPLLLSAGALGQMKDPGWIAQFSPRDMYCQGKIVGKQHDLEPGSCLNFNVSDTNTDIGKPYAPSTSISVSF